MNKMVYLIALIAELQKKTEVIKTYSQEFIDSTNKFLSPTERIKVEDLNDYFVSAGLVAADEVLPILTVDGWNVTELEPDVVGGQFPFAASDIIAIQAGVPTLTADGKEVPIADEIERKYARYAAAAISNTFERQCTDLILGGVYFDNNKRELETGVKQPIPLTWTTGKKVDKLIKLYKDYIKTYHVIPTVKIGDSIFNAIKNEANDTKQNINKVSYNMEKNTLMIGNFEVQALSDSVGTQGTVYSTDNMIILNPKSNIGVGYACLMYGDIKTNETKLVRAELVADETRVEQQSGSKGIWAKSRPMPFLLSAKKFKRYEVTL